MSTRVLTSWFSWQAQRNINLEEKGERKMASDRHYELSVVHLKGKAAEFARALQSAISDTAPRGCFVEVQHGQRATFEFTTQWDVPVEVFETLSGHRRGEVFLVQYSSLDDESHGQLVIRNGALLERFHRRGFYGPGPWYEITHPVPDLFEAHLGSRTLAQAADSRLADAIAIVKLLKEAVEEEGEKQHTRNTIANLNAMLHSMQAQASRISFDDILGKRMAKAIS
jgi:hypothetical protein